MIDLYEDGNGAVDDWEVFVKIQVERDWDLHRGFKVPQKARVGGK